MSNSMKWLSRLYLTVMYLIMFAPIAVMVLLTAPALVKGKLSRVRGVALLVIYAVFCGIQFTL